MYLGVNSVEMSLVLVRDGDSTSKPVYYMSKMMLPAKRKYLLLEEFSVGFDNVSSEVAHYFQAHSIQLLTDQPSKQVMRKPEASTKIVHWAIELSAFDINYKHWIATKRASIG